ncbi:hypothetical protein [Pseudocolwellia agarivorans]|uniref:hypothetical protein n=1 Tax=Pseudocolwellia agarivorans TaxID=1911682 RepID=UPI003F885891
MRLFIVLYITAFSSFATTYGQIPDYEALFKSSVNVSIVAVVSVSSDAAEDYFNDLLIPNPEREIIEASTYCLADTAEINVKASLVKVLKGKPKSTYLFSYSSCTANPNLPIFRRLIVYEGVNGKLHWQYATEGQLE